MLEKHYWERHAKDMEHNLYGSQRKVSNMMRNREKPISHIFN